MPTIVDSRPTRRPPALLVLTLALAVALSAVGCRGGDSTATPATTSTIVAPDPTTTAEPAPTSTVVQSLSPAQLRTIDAIKAQVSEIRGLAWKADLPIHILSPDDLSARVRQLTLDDLAEHKDEVAATEAFLELVGLIPKDLDYVKTIDKLLSGGTLGYYDDKTKELFVGGNPDRDLGPATKSTMAHELTHALTDQHFGFGTRLRALTDAERTEESFAFSSLIEGDAEHVRELWAGAHLSARERAQAAQTEGGDPSAYLTAPPYLLHSLLFPYTEGLEFVESLERSGGFRAVDTAYGRPPASSEEILHPDVYAAGRPWSAPPLPDVATAAGCQAVDTGNMGEFDMTELLLRYVDDDVAAKAAAGWDGDAYSLARCGSAIGLVDRWRADGPADLDELGDALSAWSRKWSGSSKSPDGEGKFAGPKGSGQIIRSGDRIDLVVAADASTADRLARALPAS